MIQNNPHWYQEAIIYEVHVRAFFDSNNDGVGDFKGLTQKLDYLHDLGITAIWLLPFYPSPLKDDGYDIAEYTSVNHAYGTIQDFKVFLKEAHKRDIRVITELVLNHTSDQHAWFQKSRHAKKNNHHSKWRDFYVWRDNPDGYQDARIIFQDFETSNWNWDPVARAYYWHRFYSHQPDLNYDNPEVKKAMEKILYFWLNKGVDGLRLDAVPYLYEQEGTNCENLPKTHQYLQELRAHIDERYGDKMLLAEANQWPEDAIKYFNNGDECQMAFHFPLMPRMFMSLQMEDRFPLIDILQQTPDIPANCQWALFLRNHDELTLEMVTDEERDYMYRTYAQDPKTRINLGIRRRLASLLGNNRKKIELMNALLFSLPGTPVIYYGDEIGMGDNFYLGDRNGVRTPMQWSADRNAGFSRAHPHQLYLPVVIDPEYHFEAVNVANQENNTESLLWWMKRLIAVRKHYRSLALGSLSFLYPENRKVLAFVREYQNETILVIGNFSHFSEYTKINLSKWQGCIPVEVFSQTKFPVIDKNPYFVILSPYAFHWFLITPAEEGEANITTKKPTKLTITSLQALFQDDTQRSKLEKILPNYLKQQRWYGHKAKNIKHVQIDDTIFAKDGQAIYVINFIKITTTTNEELLYMLPLTLIDPHEANDIQNQYPLAILTHIENPKNNYQGVLVDALFTQSFPKFLLKAIMRRQKFLNKKGKLSAKPSKAFHRLYTDEAINDIRTLKTEQSNTSILFNKCFILKFFRYIEPGINPDVEIGRFLTEQKRFSASPAITGMIEYTDNKGNERTISIMHEFIQSEGDAWTYTLDHIKTFFDRVLTHTNEIHLEALPIANQQVIYGQTETPKKVKIILGNFIDIAKLMGQRTGELHLALSSGKKDSDFTLEPLLMHHQRSLYQSIHMLHLNVFDDIAKTLPKLPRPMRKRCENLLKRSTLIDQFIRRLLDSKMQAYRIRCHGDLHLGQMLYTGKDFKIIDFEGEPIKPISARKLKKIPLTDVAGMLRSFHYAAQISWLGKNSVIRQQDHRILKYSAKFWYNWISAFFLRGYVQAVQKSKLLPPDHQHFVTLLDILKMEKALYELKYELNNRPDWLLIPYRGIMELISHRSLP